MQSNLDVKPSRESNVVAISYKSPDPRFSAALANAFARAYIDTTLDLRVDPAKQYSAFFDARAKDARERLEAAQAKVSEFQKANGIIASDERLDVENQRLNELSSQLVALQAVAAESALRQVQSQTSADRIQEVLNNPLIAGLKADQSRAEARLQELSSRLGDSHPQVAEARANIAALRDKVDAEIKRVTGGVGVTANINRAREATIRSSLEAQRAKVLKMKAVRDDGAVLQREVESAQRSYEALLARLTQTNLESQNNQSNIHVLTEASPPSKPAGPKVMQNTLMSLVVGLALALAVAVGLEFIDRRVRVLEDVDAAVGLPVLGVLPTPNAKRMLGRRKLSLMQQRLLSLPAPQKG
jgi:chain length determinant protein EpsF